VSNVILHLNKTRDGNACGQEGQSTTDHLMATCLECLEEHDMVTNRHLNKAIEYFDSIGRAEDLKTIKNCMITTILGDEKDPELCDTIIAWQDRHFSPDKYFKALAVIYAEVFSEDELDKLIELSTPPVVQKLRANMVKLFQSSYEIVEEMLNCHIDELMEELDKIKQ